MSSRIIFAVRTGLVLSGTLLISIVAMLSCTSGGDERSQEDGDVDVPSNAWGLMPEDVVAFSVIDVDEVFSGNVSSTLRDELEDEFGESLDDLGVSLDDVSNLSASEGLTVASGFFDFDVIRDRLEDAGLSSEDYRGFEFWEGDGSRIASSALLEFDEYVISGDSASVQDVLRGLSRGSGLVGNSSGSAYTLLRSGASGWLIQVASDCQSIGGSDCEGVAISFSGDDDQLEAWTGFLFRDADSADSVSLDLDDSMMLGLVYEIWDVGVDGRVVSISGTVDASEMPDNLWEGTFDWGDGLGQQVETSGGGSTDDHSDEIRGATRIRAGDSLEGEIELYGDLDVFRFAARSGESYNIEVVHGTISDSVMSLYDEDGNRLAYNDDSSFSSAPIIDWTSQSSGNYYFAIGGYGDDRVGSYTVRLEETSSGVSSRSTRTAAADDDHSDSDRGATRIRLGQSLSGEIGGSGDEDVFRFAARSGNRYRIDVSHGTISDTVLVLRDDNGRTLDSDDDSGSGTAARIDWTAPASGNYFFTVRGLNDTYVGTYRVEVEETVTQQADDRVIQTVIVEREVEVRVVETVIVEYEVERIVEVEVEVLREVEVPGETVVQTVIVEREVPVEVIVEKEVMVEREVPVTVVVERAVEVEVVKEVQVEKVVEVGVPVTVVVDREVEVVREVPVTVVVDREVEVVREVPVTVVVTREVIVEKEVPVTVVVTRDPSRIAFHSDRDGDFEIYIMDSDGTALSKLTNNNYGDGSPDWSPDGSKIVFTSYRDGGDSEVFVMNVDGTGIVQLTDNSTFDGAPKWSPDGRKMVFVSDRDGEDTELYVMNSDGTSVRRLTSNSSDDRWARWSPDGNRIVFHSYRDGEDLDIYVMNSDGSGVVSLTNHSEHDAAPSWSPDGEKIAFMSGRDGEDFEIFVMNADGSGVVQLTDNTSYDGAPVWSSDGRRIAFTSIRDGNDRDIYVMNTDGTGVVQLTDNSSDDWASSWSP